MQSFQKHETAIVDAGADIGNGTKIWHWVHICAGAAIGENCVISQNVFIGNGVTIGNNVKIQNNVSVYNGVFLEDDVFCGPSMVFTNVYNPRSEINRKDEFRSTIVKKGATLGANCTIVCGVVIGQYSFVAAGAVVTSDVPSYGLVAGVPGRLVGWMSAFGERLDLPLKGFGEARCSHTGRMYLLSDGKVTVRDPDDAPADLPDNPGSR